jgi:hypothetical protein
MLTIESRVPHDKIMEVWLRFHDAPLDRLVLQSHRYERAYLAWETVRQLRNPFFNIGTGFEGYFVGISQSPEEMIAELLKIGHGMLMSNCRLYRHQYTFKAKLMKTLQGELNDPRAIDVWATLLGATLAKLRCHVLYNHKTYLFQNETYWTVNRLPFIKYTQCNQHIDQVYILAPFKQDCVSKLGFYLNMFKPSDYDAALVVSKIGCFGHPLIRAYLREADRDFIFRFYFSDSY